MAPPSSAVYRDNRGKFSAPELRPFDGQWVAFSSDGRRIVANASTIGDLADQVRGAKIDLQDVVLEHIAFENDDSHVGGAELL